MKIISKLLKITLSITFITGFITSCKDEDDNIIVPPVTLTVLETVSANSNLSILASALELTDLAQTLKDNDTYTLLAPNNEAFATIDLATIDTEEEKETLKKLLLNHVILGNVTSSSLNASSATGYIKTLATYMDTPTSNPLSLLYDTSSGLRFNGISNTITNGVDIEATNGYVHIVDALIDLPTITTFLNADSNFNKLNTAITTAELTETINGLNPITIFAPDNNAFDTLSALPIDEELIKTIKHHLIDQNAILINQLTQTTVVTSLEGGDITITPSKETTPNMLTDGGGNTDINVTTIDIQTVNGTIQIIDKVLTPKS